MRTVRLRISGRVQGVGFRWFARRAAAAHGIRGYVRNTGDGGVEVVAQGERLDAFVAAVREGPRFARIDAVEEEGREEAPYEEFSVRY